MNLSDFGLLFSNSSHDNGAVIDDGVGFVVEFPSTFVDLLFFILPMASVDSLPQT